MSVIARGASMARRWPELLEHLASRGLKPVALDR